MFSFSLFDSSPDFCLRSVFAVSSWWLTWSIVASRLLLCSPTAIISKTSSVLILIDVASAPDTSDEAKVVVVPPSIDMM